MITSKSVWPLGLFAMLCVLALHGAMLLSYVWGSAGLVMLSQALTATPHVSPLWAASQAEILLRKSTTYASENYYAWRGLGFALAMQGRESEAIAAWQSAGGMAEEFIEWGTRASKSEKYQEALMWYKRAAKVDPELRDPWYYMGLTYERMEDWERAAEVYREGLQRPAMSRAGLSDLYFRLGRIWEHRSSKSDWQTALALYDQALELDAFNDEWSRVQVHYARGEVLRKLDRKRAAMKEYEWFLAHRSSDHWIYWAHVHLGFLAWELDQDAIRAEAHFLQALAIDGGSKWVYRGLGLVNQETGHWTKATEMYRQVLLLDPNDAFASEQLRAMGGDK